MRFRILNEDPLYDYREGCKATQGIDMARDAAEGTRLKDETDFWIRQIVANHSTLRSVRFRIMGEAPKSVVMQLIRATKGHPQPEVQSSRPDWNGGRERPSDPYVPLLFVQDHTAESFVEMARQRLCHRTEERTREFMEGLVMEMRRSAEPFFRALGYCCAPQCAWYGACPEIKGCGRKKFKLSDIIIGKKNKDMEEGKWA